MIEIDVFDDWRAFAAANNWADFDADSLFHAFVRASEKGDRAKERRLRIELEELRDALVKIVPPVVRIDGIEPTPDFKSPEEMTYTEPVFERHMKWAAHWLRRTVDILQMDFSDPKPGIPSAIDDAQHRIVGTIRADAEGSRNCQGIAEAIAVLLELYTQSGIVNSPKRDPAVAC